ncbi:MAG: hypothetical protein IJ661_13465 [Lachnospiraceae bacterium]|nr:hypothetical protein [Lachnospiraceae bacterium]
MKKYTVDEIITIFEKSGNLMYVATLSGDYKTNNKEGKRLTELFKIFEKETEFGYHCIDKLIKSNNVVIVTKAAAYCLALGYNVDYAVSVLQNIANDSDNGIFGFNAEMTLKVWEKNGYLKIYQ